MLTNDRPRTSHPLFLEDGGEMGELIRSINWAEKPIGSPSTWPQCLRTTVSLMLNSHFPMYIAWGNEYTQLYNDAFRPILGLTKHPQAMGISTMVTFAEIWHTIGPLFVKVMKGEAVRYQNLMLQLDRNGYVEECYFDFSYSPVKLDDGSVGGVLVTVIETTEKVKAYDSLKKAKLELELAQIEAERQRDRLKRFFMQAPAGICVLDGPELIFELINPGYQQIFPGRNLLGKRLLEAVPEIRDQPIWNILQNVYHTGKTFEGRELLIPLAYNDDSAVEDRYFNFIYQARLDARGEVDGILVFAFEVTELVATKRTVEDSEKRFKSIIEQAPVALLVNRGRDLVFDAINQPMIEIIGKGPGVKGKTVYEAIPELRGQPIMDRLYHTYYTGEEWRGYEVPIMLSAGGEPEMHYYNLIYKPLVENGQITGIMQSAVDVTGHVRARRELEQAKDTLNLAINAAGLGMFDMDLVKGTMFWDKRCRTLFGISHDDTVTYEQDFVTGLHPDDRDRILEVIRNVFIKSVSNGDYDVQYRTVGAEDQKLRWVRAKGKTYFDEEDKPLRFIGAVLDITEQKQDELRKNDFIGMVSHELKTPLTSLSAFVQMLQGRAIREEDKFGMEALAKVMKQVKKMSGMINGFLNVSRLESGKIHLQKTEFNLDELVTEMMEEARLTTTSHSITMEPCQPLRVCADHDKIGSVISNLLTNAVKYSPRGKIVAVRCELLTSEARVSVTDQGIGIKPQDLEKLFERFHRVENLQTQTISGFGIGLYLCAEIVQHHNGKIGVHSEVGVGSTFWFTLPLG